MSRLLLADIDGTYARFTLATGKVVGPAWSTEVRAYRDVAEAIAAFIEAVSGREGIDGVPLAAAGLVKDERCQLTNVVWIIDEGEIA